jgi:hypothetical protein
MELRRLLEEPFLATTLQGVYFFVVARDGSSNNLDKVHTTGCRSPK